MNIIFTDIDGTLANGPDVPDSAKQAIHDLRMHGDIIFICTGRPLSYVKKHFYKYANGFICNNGRLAVMGCCEKLYDAPVEESLLENVKQAVEKYDIGATFFTEKNAYYIGNDEGYEELMKIWDRDFLTKGTPKKPVYSFDVYYKNQKIKNKLDEDWKGICLLNPHGPHPSADVTILGSDKGDALKAVAKYLNVPIENTYAFGDGMNDICMLKAAGHGIAMGNAQEEVKEVAEYVTEAMDQKGFYNACQKYSLIK